jgi:hypothetical protein
MNQLNEQRLQLHVPVVAWLLIIGHAFFLMGAALLFSLFAGIGVAVDDRTALTILGLVGTTMGGLLAALALPGLAAGFGLLARKSWARVLAIVIAALGLANFPVGTLVGAYAIWVLLQDAGGDYFSRRPGAVRAGAAA